LEIRPRKDHRGVDLISDALPFGRLWYAEPDAAGNVTKTHEHKGDLKEWWSVTHVACSKEKQKLPRREV
jgi:hypothetical protein